MNVLMESVVSKHCKKCDIETTHRKVTESRAGRNDYYACSICLKINSKKHRKAHWYRYLAQKANARKREGSIKLKEQDVLNIVIKQEYKCALTNILFDIDSKWNKPSLDRIDSSKGYTLNNIRLTLWIVNHSKGELTDEEFTTMCKQVVHKQTRRNSG